MKRKPNLDLCGLLNINKPSGVSSRQAINAVERIIGRRKMGHAGTLDPIATGVLVVCLGRGTRLVPFVQEHPKVYRAEFLSGVTSPTDDIEADITPNPDARPIIRDELLAALPHFLGTIEQVPPIFSAVRINGQRAYELARKGEEVEIAPKQIEVHRLELLDLQEDRFAIEIECGSGTYVRSLGRDIARHLGSSAVMSTLERTSIGPFHVKNAITVDDQTTRDDVLSSVLPLQQAVPDFPTCVVSPPQIESLSTGRPVTPNLPLPHPPGTRISLLDQTGQLIALGESLDTGEVTPRHLLIPAKTSR